MTSNHDLDDLDQRLLRDWRARLVSRRQRHGLLRCGLDCVPRDFVAGKRLALQEDCEQQIADQMRAYLKQQPERYGVGLLGLFFVSVVARLVAEWLRRRIWPDGNDG